MITGNEVFTRLIEDQFEPVLRRKVDQIGSEVIGVRFAPDEPDLIEQEIRSLLDVGADLLLVTGGMSVDPDDVTRQGVAQAGAKDFIYGAPVLPGAMFMVSAIDDVPVLGIPACGLYHEATVFDLVLPRILAGETTDTGRDCRHGAWRTLPPLSGMPLSRLSLWQRSLKPAQNPERIVRVSSFVPLLNPASPPTLSPLTFYGSTQTVCCGGCGGLI